MRLLLVIMLGLGMVSCGKEKTLPKLDLLKYGLPITINAPLDAVVNADDLGIMKDVTVKSQDDYFIQIYGSTAISLDANAIFLEKKKEIKEGRFFSKIMSEESTGMIYEKIISEKNIDYDFIYVKIQGDYEYIFQTGLYGTYTQEQVQNMYESIK